MFEGSICIEEPKVSCGIDLRTISNSTRKILIKQGVAGYGHYHPDCH